MHIVPQVETDATSVASYWGVIPLPVRHCKTLQPAAKLLFSEITALTKREGYCWASNAYFQSLYEVDRATVQRWLVALVREGFIRVEVVPGTGIRRIYDLSIPPPQKQSGGAAKTKPPRRKNAIDPPQKRGPEWYINEVKEKSIESDARGRSVSPSPMPSREPQPQEEKVTASPPTVKSNSGTSPSAAKLRQVARAVAMTKSPVLQKEYEKAWDVLQGAGLSGLWQEAITRFKSLPEGASTAPSGLSAAFLAILQELAHSSGFGYLGASPA